MKKNLAISLAIFLLAYAALESTFLYWFPRWFPSNFVMIAVDQALQPLLQSSKRRVLPHDYVALLGDSYAAGMGDWATAEMPKPMARYSSAHLLQDATGRDVVSFGSAGAGSVRAMVTEPVSQLAYLRRYIDSGLEQPAWVLVYFYEGNDLYDNAAYFHYSFPRLFDVSRQYDPTTYQQYLQQFAIERDDTWWLAQRNDWLRHFPLLTFSDRVMRMVLHLPARVDPPNPAYDAALDPPWIFGGNMTKSPGTINQGIIGGQPVQLPDLLQGPALGLDENEWKQAWFAFDQSLSFARTAFPASQFALVYIPSPATCYSLTGSQVSVQAYERRNTLFTREALPAASRRMRQAFAEIAQRQGIQVIDATNALQAAGRDAALHGPNDWNHFNRRGYEILATTIAKALPAMRINAPTDAN